MERFRSTLDHKQQSRGSRAAGDTGEGAVLVVAVCVVGARVDDEQQAIDAEGVAVEDRWRSGGSVAHRHAWPGRGSGRR